METESPIRQEPVKEVVKVTFIAFPPALKVQMKAKCKELKVTQQKYVIDLVIKDLGGVV